MIHIRYIALIKLIIVLTVCFGVPASNAQPLLNQPTVANNFIRHDEVLEYNVKIRGIPAGTQILEVDGKSCMDGEEVYHLKSVSRARRLFNIFYAFSNKSESFIQSERLYPLHYTKQIRDGGYNSNINVDFDWDNQTATIIKDNKKTKLDIPPGIQDELSMIYLLRAKEMEIGRRYEFPFLSGDKALKTIVEVLRTQRLKTILGTLDTIVVKTNLKDITIWLTNDTLRIPVRIEAKTKIGKLVSKLKAVH